MTRYAKGATEFCGLLAACASAEFKYGHIYVSAADNDWCTVKGGPAAIIEIDPTTGEMTVFAHSDDHPFCSPGPIRFTPDGSRLLYSEAVFGRVLAFDGDGNSEIMMPVFLPWGMAFDAGDNLYISSGSTVKRFPADGGPFTVFADNNDGLFDVGDLAFAPTGDLFYAGWSADDIIRITPDGVGFPFDDPPGTQFSVAFDRDGTLFVAAGLTGIYRYDGGKLEQRVQLVPSGVASFRSLSLSPDHTRLFAGSCCHVIYQMDPVVGNPAILAWLTDVPIWAQAFIGGMDVYAPTIPGDMNGDGATSLQDFSRFVECVSGPASPFVNVWCRPGDIDEDADLDLHDFGRLQLLMSGE